MDLGVRLVRAVRSGCIKGKVLGTLFHPFTLSARSELCWFSHSSFQTAGWRSWWNLFGLQSTHLNRISCQIGFSMSFTSREPSKAPMFPGPPGRVISWSLNIHTIFLYNSVFFWGHQDSLAGLVFGSSKWYR